MEKPHVVILGDNALENLGLKTLLQRMIPQAGVASYHQMEEMEQSGLRFFHYFVTSELLLGHIDFFKQYVRQTMVLTGGKHPDAPAEFHQINVNMPLQSLMKQFMFMSERMSHHAEQIPEAVADEMKMRENAELTPREIEVLKALATGKSSKEIAEQLHISFSTVITHRKNMMEKLGAHSATKLVIYAVLHGYIKTEDIQD